MAYSFYLNVAFNDTFVFERPFQCNFQQYYRLGNGYLLVV